MTTTNLLLTFLVILVVGIVVAGLIVGYSFDTNSAEAWRIWSAGLTVASFASGWLARSGKESVVPA